MNEFRAGLFVDDFSEVMIDCTFSARILSRIAGYQEQDYFLSSESLVRLRFGDGAPAVSSQYNFHERTFHS
jgi:hypothetical protein